jgi:hypothetical protein
MLFVLRVFIAGGFVCTGSLKCDFTLILLVGAGICALFDVQHYVNLAANVAADSPLFGLVIEG